VFLEAASGDEALALSTRHPGPIGLLLVGVIMPGMSGADRWHFLPNPFSPRGLLNHINALLGSAATTDWAARRTDIIPA